MPDTDILLATANFMGLDPKQRRKGRPYPPLATLYAASRLRAAGFSVALFDAMLADERAFEIRLRQTRPRIVALYEDNFNFLTKMCLRRMREAALAMARASRRAGATVTAAGADVSDHPHVYLTHGVDYALVGEPDHTLAEVTAAVLGGRDARDLPGVVTLSQDGGGLRRAQPRVPERELDRFPAPAWDLVDVEAYRRAWQDRHGRFSLNLVTTRGCPFHCNWCAKPIWGQRYAMHSPERVAADLAHLKDRYRPDHIWFADDIFGLRPDWVVEFAREVSRLDAAVAFTIQSRADLMTDAAVEALAHAGCAEVWLGAESGSQTILDAMQKGTTLEDIAAARERLGRRGIRACFFLQLGYPGEEWADILETAAMVRRLLPDDIGVSVSYPLPGTAFYERVRSELGGKTHWDDSDDLSMMFKGTYTSAFYRRLHALLHRELEIRQAERSGLDRAAALAGIDREWDDLARQEPANRRRGVLPLALVPAPARPILDLNAN
jgi:anaerobic magnesium-protoporphyrin IX monomethyl ester cyclase